MLIHKDWNSNLKLITSLIFSIIIAISVIINSGYLQFLDSMFIANVQRNESGFKTSFYSLITMLANPKFDILWILIIAFILWGFKYKIYALWALFTLGSGDVFGAIIKELVRRPRPLLHLAKDHGFSFPSMHVFGITIVMAIIWILVVPFVKKNWLQWGIKIVSLILILLTMMSRIYLNAHFPTDTLGGLLLAYSWLQICERIYLKIEPKVSSWHVFQNNRL